MLGQLPTSTSYSSDYLFKMRRGGPTSDAGTICKTGVERDLRIDIAEKNNSYWGRKKKTGRLGEALSGEAAGGRRGEEGVHE